MMGVQWLGKAEGLFPYPEPPQALIDETLGRPGVYAAADGAQVVAARHVAWNAALLDAFKAAATQLPARLCVVRNTMTEHTAALGTAALTDDGAARVYDLFLVDRPLTDVTDEEATLADLRQRAHPVRVTLPVDEMTVRTPGYGAAPYRFPFPLARAWVAHVTRWPHLLWLLQGAPYALCGGQNVVGQNVRIHSTALVEGSVLEDGVEVEAHATVVGSYIGRGARLADHSAIHHSVIGPGCSTLADTFLRRVVALPGSTISNLDLCEVLLGRGVFITAGVIFFTGAKGVTVRVGQGPDDEQDTGRSELGGAVGHACVLGTRAIFVPGRALPGGTVIVMRHEEGVLTMPTGLAPGTLTAWDNAALVKVSERWPGYRAPEVDE
ncbi:MAG: hypothetical protein AB2A00_37455 [Myxococcota bacterium]